MKPKVIILRNLQDAFGDGECDDWLMVYDAEIQSAVADLASQGVDIVKITIRAVRE